MKDKSNSKQKADALKEIKDAQDSALSIPDTDRYGGADNMSAADTSAFPIDINRKGGLVSMRRTTPGETVVLDSDESVFTEVEEIENPSDKYKELKAKIEKKFPLD